jgi:ribose transport system permease protein
MPVVILAVQVAYFAARRFDTFMTVANWQVILNSTAILAIVSAGLTVVLAVGDFDLSFGPTLTIGGILAAKALSDDPSNWAIAGAVVLALAVGAVVGFANGAIVTTFGISSFVATLGVSAVLSGLILWITDGGQTVAARSRVQGLANSEFLGIRSAFWIALGVVVLLTAFVARTVAGRRIDAIGGNAEAARLAGLRVPRYRVLAFVLAGTCAAGAGVLLMARVGSATSNAGDPFLLEAYTAAFLGAVTLRTGEFHVLGTFFGVLYLQVTFNGIAQMGWPTFWPDIVRGVVLILAVSASGIVQRLFAAVPARARAG